MDALAGTLIISVGTLGMTSLIGMLMNMTERHVKMSSAILVAKAWLEETKNKGFPNTAEGTQTRYYDANGQNYTSTKTSGSAYKAVLVVTSDKLTTTASGTQVAPTATRTVTVTVSDTMKNKQILKWGTLLVRGGV